VFATVPSAAVMVAFLPLEAVTLVRSCVVGAATGFQVSPSVVRRIWPERPTSQHVLGDGAEPAISDPAGTIIWIFHVFPESPENSIPPPAIRQDFESSGVGMTSGSDSTSTASDEGGTSISARAAGLARAPTALAPDL